MTGRLSRAFSPPTDVIEMQDKLLVIVEIAGMRPDDFSITLHNSRLIITGMRRHLLTSQNINTNGTPAYHQLEIGYGEFRVDVTLPWAIERDLVSASYRDGFLQVELPRQAERRIPVARAGAGNQTKLKIGLADNTNDQ